MTLQGRPVCVQLRATSRRSVDTPDCLVPSANTGPERPWIGWQGPLPLPSLPKQTACLSCLQPPGPPAQAPVPGRFLPSRSYRVSVSEGGPGTTFRTTPEHLPMQHPPPTFTGDTPRERREWPGHTQEGRALRWGSSAASVSLHMLFPLPGKPLGGRPPHLRLHIPSDPPLEPMTPPPPSHQGP